MAQPAEPTVRERELALGYAADATAAPGLSLQARHELTGNAIDANTAEALFAICWAWQARSFSAMAATVRGGDASDASGAAPEHDNVLPLLADGDLFATAHAESMAATDEERATLPTSRPSTDIWHDPPALHLLQHRTYPDGLPKTERSRIWKRAQLYEWRSGKLWRLFRGGPAKEVPAPHLRQQLVHDTHDQFGHFGVKRTASLVLTHQWWAGLMADVEKVVRSCHLCDRARVAFGPRTAQLHPLPIRGPFYRWGVDLFGPLPPTAGTNSTYVMLAICHFTKHLVAVPIPSKEAVQVAMAFALHVLAPFGGPGEVVTDGGSEFKGEFADLMAMALVDHRVTSPNHPQADGLAERAVQTVKRSLRKMVERTGNATDWDRHLPWLLLGYNCSPQQSTGYSPYELVFGAPPRLPATARDQMTVPLNLEAGSAAPPPDPSLPGASEAIAAELLKRGALMQRHVVLAGAHLEVAQQRDTLRYARLRSGSYLPTTHTYGKGDFVYVKGPAGSTLQLRARPLVYRIKLVRSSGVLELQGKCGRVVKVHPDLCAPCHLWDLDPTIDRTLAAEEVRWCEFCRSTEDQDSMIECAYCGDAWHGRCCPQAPQAPLQPGQIWLCVRCRAEGMRPEAVAEIREERRLDAAEARQAHQRFSDVQLSVQQAKSARLNGRLASRPGDSEAGTSTQWGYLRYLGPRSAAAFEVRWHGGATELVSRTAIDRGQVVVHSRSASPPASLVVPPMQAHEPDSAATSAPPSASPIREPGPIPQRRGGGWYEAEDIVAHRRIDSGPRSTRRAKFEYKVRFAGYAEEHDLWLPADALSRGLVAAYESRLSDAEEAPTRPRRQVMVLRYPSRPGWELA